MFVHKSPTPATYPNHLNVDATNVIKDYYLVDRTVCARVRPIECVESSSLNSISFNCIVNQFQYGPLHFPCHSSVLFTAAPLQSIAKRMDPIINERKKNSKMQARARAIDVKID